MRILLCLLPPASPDYPPLGAAALAGALTAAGHDCRILDTNIHLYRCHPDEQWRWSDIGWYFWSSPESYRAWIEEVAGIVVESVIREEGACVALSASSAAKPFARECIRKLRKKFPSLPILIGGAGFFHSEDIAAFSAAEGHQVCQGEGDEALVQWVDQLGPGNPGGRVARARVRSLDSLAVPDFSCFTHEQYVRPGVFPAETSRGCVNHCAFCDDTQMWGGFRMKSPQKVSTDLGGLPGAARHVSFCDSLLNPTPQRMFAVSEAIGAYDLTWDGMLQCRGVDVTVARAMRASGCRDVFLGVESFDPALLQALHKASTAEQAEQAIRALHQAGIKVSIGFIVAGPPFQNRAGFERDLETLARLAEGLASVAVNPLCIPQGTSLWETGKRLGLCFPQKAPWQFWHTRDSDPGIRFSWAMEAVTWLSDLGLYRMSSTGEALHHLEQLADNAWRT